MMALSCSRVLTHHWITSSARVQGVSFYKTADELQTITLLGFQFLRRYFHLYGHFHPFSLGTDKNLISEAVRKLLASGSLKKTHELSSQGCVAASGTAPLSTDLQVTARSPSL